MIAQRRIKSHIPLRESVKTALNEISLQLDGKYPPNLYRLVLSEVERPLFEKVLEYTNGNQSKASEILGITRSTLKKKLDYYDIDAKSIG
ncbi:helix-turn-helix domain-containing protein [Wohlfahrtiimonas chitiniclastica]|jgi:Fis family transcriptional regulator|uniref:Putative Fis-like DNA-binding protein n=3 Tax=Wohlfahrtiimonas TaxID=582472 RepID=L8Y0E4_9GAMM|nr:MULTISPECIES: helix-turn-helix domain-containing protein [Wohlfahrtiimonas]ELV08524.1 DNA-binding protein fis [Wohlfahrtiimonas chitiniclastica SH04]KZS22707.1 DNA-binding protein fis [Wohlfahrtiimonas chitiniclastica]KZX38185.1 Fis family transcriptional regulator [Wohlfahrtiimonas chitiniclastica]MBS7815012.1 Fis family transcriptional regulator [Wohlfahrtiimonas chitiniclastica]MBS7815992.1 Fis family transcriptional regulator [Wohlfahrtiimonas chitiniclastica]